MKATCAIAGMAAVAFGQAPTSVTAPTPANSPPTQWPYPQPKTLQKFKANSQFTTSIEMGAMMKMDLVQTGVMYVDVSKRAVRSDFTSMEMKIDMGALMPPTEMAMQGDGTNLLRYDLLKNFTWYTQNGQTTCTCEPLTDEMPPYFIDPMSTEGADQRITINGVSFTADVWSSSIELGGAITLDMNYFLNPTNPTHLRRVENKMGMSSGGQSMMDSSNTFDFWNIETTFPTTVWMPHDSCVCPSPPALPILPDVSWPTGCQAAPDGCACIPTNVGEGIVFCDGIVTWPILGSIFASFTDSFVRDVVALQTMVFPSSSAACKQEYKEFMCRFYFQTCAVGGVLSMPSAFAGSSCDASFASSMDENAAYTEADNMANGGSASGGTGGGGGGGGNSSPANSISSFWAMWAVGVAALVRA